MSVLKHFGANPYLKIRNQAISSMVSRVAQVVAICSSIVALLANCRITFDTSSHSKRVGGGSSAEMVISGVKLLIFEILISILAHYLCGCPNSIKLMCSATGEVGKVWGSFRDNSWVGVTVRRLSATIKRSFDDR